MASDTIFERRPGHSTDPSEIGVRPHFSGTRVRPRPVESHASSTIPFGYQTPFSAAVREDRHQTPFSRGSRRSRTGGAGKWYLTPIHHRSSGRGGAPNRTFDG